MPRYDRTRNRKRKKTKQINKRTSKQPARGKTERNYKRSMNEMILYMFADLAL